MAGKGICGKTVKQGREESKGKVRKRITDGREENKGGEGKK
jgi:hypothetical protein